MFKTQTYNFPFPLDGIVAIRIERSNRGYWYVELLDEFGRNRVPVRTFPDKESAMLQAKFQFDRLTAKHVNDNLVDTQPR